MVTQMGGSNAPRGGGVFSSQGFVFVFHQEMSERSNCLAG